jgi:hypothetical protein
MGVMSVRMFTNKLFLLNVASNESVRHKAVRRIFVHYKIHFVRSSNLSSLFFRKTSYRPENLQAKWCGDIIKLIS